MADAKDDPRENKRPDGGSKIPQVGESDARPAPGGAGTGTKGAPEHEPAAQPGGQQRGGSEDR